MQNANIIIDGIIIPRVRWHFLDEDDWEEEDEPPAALRVVVLEDAGDPPLAVHGAGRHAAVLRLLTHQQPLAIDPLAIQKTFWHRRRLHLHLKSCAKTSFSPPVIGTFRSLTAHRSQHQPRARRGKLLVYLNLYLNANCLFGGLYLCIWLWELVFIMQ